MNIDLQHLATMRNDELVRRGLVAEQITELRERYVAHTRRIGPIWARSVGMWARMESLDSISRAVGREHAAVKSYARARGPLRWRTRKLHRTQAQLAVLSFASWPTPAREVARRYGALPLEVVLGRLFLTGLLVEEQVRFVDVLGWEPARLEDVWRRLGLRISLERPTRLDEPSYVAEVVRTAKREAADRRALIQHAVELAEREAEREAAR